MISGKSRNDDTMQRYRKNSISNDGYLRSKRTGVKAHRCMCYGVMTGTTFIGWLSFLCWRGAVHTLWDDDDFHVRPNQLLMYNFFHSQD